jgi:anti-anti-sigma factor
MDIRARLVNGVAILDLDGRLAVGAEESASPPLRSMAGALIAQGNVRIALNLSHLTSIDAWGLGELAVVYMLVRQVGGELTLVAPAPRVRRMLTVTRLDSILAIRDSEAQLTPVVHPTAPRGVGALLHSVCA